VAREALERGKFWQDNLSGVSHEDRSGYNTRRRNRGSSPLNRGKKILLDIKKKKNTSVPVKALSIDNIICVCIGVQNSSLLQQGIDRADYYLQARHTPKGGIHLRGQRQMGEIKNTVCLLENIYEPS